MFQRLQRLVSIVTCSAHCTALAHTWSRKRHSALCSAEKYGHLATHRYTGDMVLVGVNTAPSFCTLHHREPSPKPEGHEPIWTPCNFAASHLCVTSFVLTAFNMKIRESKLVRVWGRHLAKRESRLQLTWNKHQRREDRKRIEKVCVVRQMSGEQETIRRGTFSSHQSKVCS